MLKLLCFTDAHINNGAECRQVEEYLRRAIGEHQPHAVVSLGDLFDSVEACRELGPGFRDRMRAIMPQWLFVYGNHDGSVNTQGDGKLGWEALAGIFGPLQQAVDIAGTRCITLGDQQAGSDWQAFAHDQAMPGCVILSHGVLKQAQLDRMEEQGALLAVNGHRHVSHVQKAQGGRLRQYTLSPFRFGGRRIEPGGYALFEVHSNIAYIRRCPVDPPPLPSNGKVLGTSADTVFAWDMSAHFPGDPDAWVYVPPLSVGEREWLGGPGRLQLRRNGAVVWDKRFGRSAWDACPTTLARQGDREYLIVAGTWVKVDGVEGYHSLFIVDPDTGTELYRVRVIGVTAPPVVRDGVMYIVGEWREAIAVELATGRELWRRRSQTETPRTAGLVWEDARAGGGWSVCPPAVGRHVWCVNARGDLFAYERETGRELITYPGAVPCNPRMTCPYAPTLACAPMAYATRQSFDGERVFEINRLIIEDTALRVFM